MPAHKSAVKRLRQSKRLHSANIDAKSSIKSLSHQLNSLVLNNKKEEAVTVLRKIESSLDKAAKRGIIHKNAASRRKSRLYLKINKIKQL